MLRQLVKPVLLPLLALALVALFFHGTRLLLARPAAAPANTPATTTATALPESGLDSPSDGSETRTASDAIHDWRPDIDQVIDQLEEIMVGDIPQQQMNYTLSNLNALYDTQLYLTFIDYLANLPPEQVQAALKEQQQWLAERQTLIHTAQESGHVEDEGSLTTYTAGEAYLQITRQRLDEINRRLPH